MTNVFLFLDSVYLSSPLHSIVIPPFTPPTLPTPGNCRFTIVYGLYHPLFKLMDSDLSHRLTRIFKSILRANKN